MDLFKKRLITFILIQTFVLTQNLYGLGVNTQLPQLASFSLMQKQIQKEKPIPQNLTKIINPLKNIKQKAEQQELEYRSHWLNKYYENIKNVIFTPYLLYVDPTSALVMLEQKCDEIFVFKQNELRQDLELELQSQDKDQEEIERLQTEISEIQTTRWIIWFMALTLNPSAKARYKLFSWTGLALTNILSKFNTESKTSKTIGPYIYFVMSLIRDSRTWGTIASKGAAKYNGKELREEYENLLKEYEFLEENLNTLLLEDGKEINLDQRAEDWKNSYAEFVRNWGESPFWHTDPVEQETGIKVETQKQPQESWSSKTLSAVKGSLGKTYNWLWPEKQEQSEENGQSLIQKLTTFQMSKSLDLSIAALGGLLGSPTLMGLGILDLFSGVSGSEEVANRDNIRYIPMTKEEWSGQVTSDLGYYRDCEEFSHIEEVPEGIKFSAKGYRKGSRIYFKENHEASFFDQTLYIKWKVGNDTPAKFSTDILSLDSYNPEYKECPELYEPKSFVCSTDGRDGSIKINPGVWYYETIEIDRYRNVKRTISTDNYFDQGGDVIKTKEMALTSDQYHSVYMALSPTIEDNLGGTDQYRVIGEVVIKKHEDSHYSSSAPILPFLSSSSGVPEQVIPPEIIATGNIPIQKEYWKIYKDKGKVSHGNWGETAEGLQVVGSEYRDSNIIYPNAKIDLTNSEIFVKWKPGGDTYAGFGIFLGYLDEDQEDWRIRNLPITINGLCDYCPNNSERSGLGSHATTDHSWDNSKVLNKGEWYYTRIKVSADKGTWESVISTGNYDTQGGKVVEDRYKGDLLSKDLKYLKEAVIGIGFGDSYGARKQSLVVGEVTISKAIEYSSSLASTVITASSESDVLSEGLIAHYSFNGDAHDESGHGLTGEVHGAKLTQDRFGNPDSAYLFDGRSSYISCPGLNIDNYPELTVAAWANPTDVKSGHPMRQIWSNDNGGFDRALSVYDVGDSTWVICAGDISIKTGVPTYANKYVHVVVVFSKTNTELFVDGKKVWQRGSPSTRYHGSPDLKIGRSDYGGASSHFEGTIDSIRVYGQSLSEERVKAIYDAEKDPGFEPMDLTKNLVASYPFNGDAEDESGHGNTGIVHGAALVKDRFGVPNSAYSFNGVSDYIDIGAVPSIQGKRLDALTQGAWIKTDFRDQKDWNQIIMTRRQADYNNDWPSIEIDEKGKAVIGVDCANYHTQAASLTRVNDGKWHYVVGVKKGNLYQIYVDGKLEGEMKDTHELHWSSAHYHIGHHGGWNKYFSGVIDDVRLYNRALSHEEIEALYELSENKNSDPIVISTGDKIKLAPGQSFRLPVQEFFRDPNEDDMTFSVVKNDGTPLDGWILFDKENSVLHGEPKESDLGKYYVKIIANDQKGGEAYFIKEIEVADTNPSSFNFFTSMYSYPLYIGLLLGLVGFSSLCGVYLYKKRPQKFRTTRGGKKVTFQKRKWLAHEKLEDVEEEDDSIFGDVEMGNVQLLPSRDDDNLRVRNNAGELRIEVQDLGDLGDAGEESSFLMATSGLFKKEIVESNITEQTPEQVIKSNDNFSNKIKEELIIIGAKVQTTNQDRLAKNKVEEKQITLDEDVLKHFEQSSSVIIGNEYYQLEMKQQKLYKNWKQDKAVEQKLEADSLIRVLKEVNLELLQNFNIELSGYLDYLELEVENGQDQIKDFRKMLELTKKVEQDKKGKNFLSELKVGEDKYLLDQLDELCQKEADTNNEEPLSMVFDETISALISA